MTVDREQEVTASLRVQLEEVQKREEEVRRESDRLRAERERQEERISEMEAGSHRRYTSLQTM